MTGKPQFACNKNSTNIAIQGSCIM